MNGYWWVVPAILGPLALLAAAWLPLRALWGLARFREARRDFHRHRERLEAKFVALGTSSVRHGSPRWTDCEFDDDVSYARNRATGVISAFVATTIVLENPDDETVAALDPLEEDGNRRAATAVFRFDGKRWDTDGRVLFNLSPAQAIRFYHHELESLGQEASKR